MSAHAGGVCRSPVLTLANSSMFRRPPQGETCKQLSPITDTCAIEKPPSGAVFSYGDEGSYFSVSLWGTEKYVFPQTPGAFSRVCCQPLLLPRQQKRQPSTFLPNLM